MKLSDGFDARRLRSKGPSNWRFRFGVLIAALLAAVGVMLCLAGIATLVGHPPQMTGIDFSMTGAAIVAVVGLVLLYLGVALWRRCRRRLRSGGSLDMAPHLLKKHD